MTRTMRKEEDPKKKIRQAVVMVHGMGEQRPLQTLNQLSRQLFRRIPTPIPSSIPARTTLRIRTNREFMSPRVLRGRASRRSERRRLL